MSNFDAAVAIILGDEGRQSNDPNDPGGETDYGHDQVSWPDLLDRVPSWVRNQLPGQVKDLTRPLAVMAYDYGYWRAFGCDLLSAPLALVVFDAVVNQGTTWAPRAFQRCLFGVEVDGDIGPKTAAAAAEQDPVVLVGEFTYQRLQRYRSLDNYVANGHGWETRAIRTAALAFTYTAP